MIQALVALVSGQQFGVGQPLPAGYGMYNVPFAYRDQYYDTNDAWYRYANGYVYRVDPRTRLIEDSFPIYVSTEYQLVMGSGVQDAPLSCRI